MHPQPVLHGNPEKGDASPTIQRLARPSTRVYSRVQPGLITPVGNQRERVAWALVAVLPVFAVVDVPTLFGLGPAVTVFALLVTSLAWFADPWVERSAWVAIRYLILAVVVSGVFEVAHGRAGIATAQTFAILGAFISTYMLASREAAAGRLTFALLAKWIANSAWIASALYGLSIARGGFGADSIAGSRTFALLTLALLPCTLTAYFAFRRGSYLYVSVLLTVLTAASLSRMASLIALMIWVVLAGRFLTLSKIGRLALRILMIATFLTPLVFFTSFVDRFSGGDRGIRLGSLTLNTSGRITLWKATYIGAMHKPWFGHGTGAAKRYLHNLYGIDHPHNEYLRFFYDGGLVVLLLVITFGFVAWRRLSRQIDCTKVHVLAARVSLMAIAAAAMTDNPFSYVFVMIPLALVLGVGLSLPSPGKRAGGEHVH